MSTISRVICEYHHHRVIDVNSRHVATGSCPPPKKKNLAIYDMCSNISNCSKNLFLAPKIPFHHEKSKVCLINFVAFVIILRSGTDPISLILLFTCFFFLLGRPLLKKPITLHRFKSDWDKVWQDCKIVLFATVVC